jgi:transcriptional regulator with XRE-family HTH domain
MPPADHLAVRQTIARRIRRWRQLASMTQAELAEAVGVTQATLSHYETGKRDVSVATLLRIAEVLGVSLQDLTEATPPARSSGHRAPRSGPPGR